MPPSLTIPISSGPDRVHVPESAISFTASRASGPGGQNVNKVSSKVDLRVDINAIVGMSPPARARLYTLCANRLDAQGRLQVISQKTRDQARNLEDALQKVRELILQALAVPTPRRKTRPSRGAVERRLTDKRVVARKKAARGRSGSDD